MCAAERGTDRRHVPTANLWALMGYRRSNLRPFLGSTHRLTSHALRAL